MLPVISYEACMSRVLFSFVNNEILSNLLGLHFCFPKTHRSYNLSENFFGTQNDIFIHPKTTDIKSLK